MDVNKNIMLLRHYQYILYLEIFSHLRNNNI